MSSSRDPGDICIKHVFAAAIASMFLTALGNLNASIYDNAEGAYLARLAPTKYVLEGRVE